MFIHFCSFAQLHSIFRSLSKYYLIFYAIIFFNIFSVLDYRFFSFYKYIFLMYLYDHVLFIYA